MDVQEKIKEVNSTLQLSGKQNKLLGNIENLERIVAWEKGQISAPAFVQFGPVSYCNHKCLHCYVENNMTGDRMSPDIYLKTIRDILSVYLADYFTGIIL